MAFLVAVLAAGGFALASVGQQYVAARTSQDHALKVSLLVRLAMNWRWLAATGVDVVAFALEALALALGSLVLVETILPSSLLFALPLSASLLGRRLSRSEWIGSLCVAGGIAAFLIVGSPAAGRSQAPAHDWWVLVAVIAPLVGILVIVGVRSSVTTIRAGCWAAAGAITYAFMSAVTKSTVDLLSDGVGLVITSWQLYALAFSALLGTLLIQSAYQAGSLTASMPIMVMTEPISGVLIGSIVFAEHLNNGPLQLAVMGAALLTTFAGVLTLSRSPLASYLV